MARDLPKYVYRETDRHGKVRHYYRPPGALKTPIAGEPGTPEFAANLERAMGAKPRSRVAPEPRKAGPMPGTLRWLCGEYYRSDAFLSLDQRTRYVRQQVVEHCLKEPTEPGGKLLFADFPLDRLSSKAIKVLRDRKLGLPEAANVRVKSFRQIFAWAIEAELSPMLTVNHARDVAYKPRGGDGFHAWSLADVEKFEECHPIGTTARLAMALLLYTGQRRSDVVVLGRQHVRSGWLIFTQFKGRNRHPARMEIPIIPELQRIIDASPTGDLTFLQTAFGKAFTVNGFGNRMRKWCDEASLAECASHGLRKAAAARLAELGCSDREIMSITGHTTTKEIDRYTKSARQRQLAENVLRRFVPTGGTE